MSSNVQTFYADAVLFDMDGTLTDSIAAVEAAWGKVAKDIGQDPAYVIAATHGKRAVDNLAQFKPFIRVHEMDAEVQKFEESILFFADAYRLHGPGSSSISRTHSSSSSTGSTSDSEGSLDAPSSLSTTTSLPPTHHHQPISTPLSSGEATPELVSSTPGSLASSRASSFAALTSRRPSFATRLNGMLAMSAVTPPSVVSSAYDASNNTWIAEEDEEGILAFEPEPKKKQQQQQQQQQQPCLEVWQIEAAKVDRCVRILPGVRRMLDSIPKGRYAVATSGAKTYAHGCMTRVGIVPPKVTITADDKRLKAGKPAPDPFLLAASELGFSASNCVVFEDSPSGIRAGLASGATVIAVCTSHERKQIEHIGAHFVVDNMESVICEPCADGRLRFTVRV